MSTTNPIKSAAIAVGVLLAAGGLLAGAWFGRAQIAPPRQPDSERNAPDDGYPEISSTGPHPKVVADELEHDFGTTVVEVRQSHAFVVRNGGEAPLVLRKGKSTCKCTVSELEKGELPPGETARIELAWQPKKTNAEFRESALILTNDPEHRELRFSIHGRVVDLIETIPHESWNVGTVAEDGPVKVSGRVYSVVLPEFRILDVTASKVYLTAEAVPLSQEELDRLGAKSGYEVRATLEPRMPSGAFHAGIHLRTDVEDHETLRLSVIGKRSEAVEFVKVGDFIFYADVRALDLGRFESAEGRQATLLMSVRRIEGGEEVRITGIETDPAFLDVAVTANTDVEGKTRQHFRVVISVPPGSPSTVRLQKDSGKVFLRTNHPDVPELKFHVQFVSF